MNALKTSHNAAIEQRLRFMMARDLSSRKYYLDAETLYEGRHLGELSLDEVAMLTTNAVTMGNARLARNRLQHLYEAKPDHSSVESLMSAISDLEEPLMRAKAFVQPRIRLALWIASVVCAFVAGLLLRSP